MWKEVHPNRILFSIQQNSQIHPTTPTFKQNQSNQIKEGTKMSNFPRVVNKFSEIQSNNNASKSNKQILTLNFKGFSQQLN